MNRTKQIVSILLLAGIILSMSTALSSAAPNSREALSLELASLADLITNPEDGETVSGTVSITTSTSCSIYIDGTRVAWRTTRYTWDTTNYADGSHTIRASSYRYGSDTITVYVNNGGGGDDTTPPVVSITNPAGGSTVSGTVSVTASASDNVGVTQVEFYIDGSLRATDTGSPYSYSWDTTGYSDGSSHAIEAIAYDAAGNTDADAVTVTVDNSAPPVGEKIAVFFSASDAYTPASYFTGTLTNILKDEGYTKFFYFRDSYNPQADMQEVDAYESSEDTVFIYILGHGNNNGQHSYTAFRPGASIVYSNDFRDWYDDLEASHKCLFVESCHSGDWADDHAATPYLAMSTSDETHLSYVGTYGGVQVGIGTYYFFRGIDNGYTGVQAFNYMRNYISSQYPKIRDYSDYVWFD
ncbi:MAG: Ig-like domain-containing protein [Candidatus Odinarchaeota archaeon]